jgi:Cu2+-exporting ATPase
MVGDGNAPVLAAADVSMVLRSGSALAQTAGDLLLLDNAWLAVPRAVAVARRARQILRQNLIWAAWLQPGGDPRRRAGLAAALAAA